VQTGTASLAVQKCQKNIDATLLDLQALDSLVEFLLEPSATDGRSVEEVRRRAMELLEGRPLPDDCSILKLLLV
jgi:hypothetical protein